MKLTDLFGLATRIVGLIVSLYGMDWLIRFCLGQIGYFTLQKTDLTYYLIMGIVYLSAGAYFLRGAPHFVRYAYSEDNAEEDDKQTTSDDKETSVAKP